MNGNLGDNELSPASASILALVRRGVATAGRLLFFPTAFIGAAAIFDASFRSNSPFDPAWIALSGWLAILVVVPCLLSALIVNWSEPRQFWESFHPLNAGLCALGIEFLWWTPERATQSAATLGLAVAVVVLVSRNSRWVSLRWLPATAVALPVLVSAMMQDLGRYLSPWIATATLCVGFALISRRQGD